jgi:hypothetical protein
MECLYQFWNNIGNSKNERYRQTYEKLSSRVTCLSTINFPLRVAWLHFVFCAVPPLVKYNRHLRSFTDYETSKERITNERSSFYYFRKGHFGENAFPESLNADLELV